MGIYDRNYYHEPEAGSTTLPQSIVTTLIVANFGIAVVDLLTPETAATRAGAIHWLNEQMALPSSLFREPWNFWKLLTAGFAHQSLSMSGGVWHVAWNMYALWLFGRAVETVYGAREFLRIYLVLILGSSLIWLVAQNVMSEQPARLVGASGAVAGITILFVLHFPHARFMMLFIPYPVPAWVIGVIIVGSDVLGAVGLRDDSIAFAAHLGGAGLAYLYYRSGIRLTSWFSGWRLPRFRAKPRLRIHQDDRDSDDIERRADEILAKINRQGADSLTAEERRILSAYSRRMRQKHS
jgi:membrane associated rhomboid family serine protease